MTKYYNDKYNCYNEISMMQKTVEVINRLFENPKLANIAGFVSGVAGVVVLVGGLF